MFVFGRNDSNLNALIASNNSELIFGKDYSGTFSEFARIDNNGLVGIGTDNPNYLLIMSTNQWKDQDHFPLEVRQVHSWYKALI